jgi:hypothetical protein
MDPSLESVVVDNFYVEYLKTISKIVSSCVFFVYGHPKKKHLGY